MKVIMKSDDTPQAVSITEQVEDGTLLSILLTGLAERDEYVKEKIFDPVEGKLRQEFFVLLNGELCASNTALEIRLKNSDELELVPPVTGG